MTANPNFNITKSLFLRQQNSFPDDNLEELAFELNKVYVDIANAINNRTVAMYPIQKSAETGESWFIRSNKKQQTLRKVFSFTSTASINHGITLTEKGQVVQGYGSYVETTTNNTYGLIFGTNVAIAGQISFYVTLTQIIFNVGAGAPTLSSGIIVLKWLSEP